MSEIHRLVRAQLAAEREELIAALWEGHRECGSCGGFRDSSQSCIESVEREASEIIGALRRDGVL